MVIVIVTWNTNDYNISSNNDKDNMLDIIYNQKTNFSINCWEKRKDKESDCEKTNESMKTTVLGGNVLFLIPAVDAGKKEA